MTEHLEHMHQFYGLQQGVRIARKHIQAYPKLGSPAHTGFMT